MAQKRMFSQLVVLSDDFLELPPMTRCLYFTLGVLADDDGFVNNPRSAMRQCGAAIDDMDRLEDNGYIIRFKSGVLVIRHWHVNNYLRADRYTPTKCVDEMASLTCADSGEYTMADANGAPSGIPNCPPDAGKVVCVDKIRKNKINRGGAGKPPRTHFVAPTVDEVRQYVDDKGYCIDAELFVDHYTANGWKQSRGKPIVDWKAAVRTWQRREIAGKDGTGHDSGEQIIL